MVGFLLCTLLFTQALLSVNSANYTELVEGDEVPVKQTWDCPTGWSIYRGDTQVTCIYMSAEGGTYNGAKSKCHDLGGFLVTFEEEDKRKYAIEFARNVSVGDVWVGLRKADDGYGEFFWEGRKSVVAVGYMQQIATPIMFHHHRSNLGYLERRDVSYYSSQCGFISASTNKLELTTCWPSYYFICEREVSCKPEYYGHLCKRECHCLRQLCGQEFENDQEGAVCKYGCKKNWAGDDCKIKKEEPEVKYYCINAAEGNDKYVYIRIYTKGLQYRSIYGLTSDKVRGEWCNSTITESHNFNLTTIKIPVNNISVAQMSSGECAGQQVGQDTFSWSIVLKEYGVYLDELDAQFKVTCDFSVADNLVRSGESSLGREETYIEENVIGPESVQDDVLLRMIDSATEKPTTKAIIGTPVILEMKYALQQGSLLLGIRPHNCVVYTQNGKYFQQLLDENGCQVPISPVKQFRIEEDNKIRTPWFKLFTFENETSVTFRCAFDLCFTSDCKVGCQQKSRQRRDTAHLTDEVAHSTTRTIRVLPSIPAKGEGQAEDYQPARPPAAPPGYDMGPFVYLNPVTCSLFLLILLVFLCMYIAFIRTMRKSVYDIRKEIEVKRSRDKFLHCGCVQQKDRDYVAP